jgi:hypothetical protein
VKKLSALLLITLLLSGCTVQTYDNFGSSAPESEQELSFGKLAINENDSLIPVAKNLLDADKTITELFVGGLLATLVSTEGKDPVDYTPATGTKYENFSTVEKLLTSTYSVASGLTEKYLSYPKYGNHSIVSKDGKTYFSFHYKEDYKGIDTENILINDGLDNNQKKIIAGGYTLTMVYDGASWLLEDSVYFMQKENEKPVESTAVFPNMNKGSAATLSGKILVVEILVTEKKGTITEDKTAVFDQKIKDSVNFILNSSVEHRGSLAFEYKQFYFTHSQAIEFSTSEPYAFDMVLATTKYGDFEKYIKDNVDVTAYDGYFAVICADKTGTGFALPYSDGESKVLTTERCVLFSNDDTGLLAKNILALFGAQTQTDAYLAKLMKNYCENEIMFAPPLQGAQISELTAYQTGITKYLDNQFNAFIPTT